jgi:hypothetical protein
MDFCLCRLPRADDPKAIVAAVGVSQEHDAIFVRGSDGDDALFVGRMVWIVE